MNPVRLVLLPGMDGTGILFEPLLEALPPGVAARVVAFPSSEPQTYLELLPSVLASLEGDGASVLLGESFSGPLALMAAAEAPPGLRGVILGASFVRNPTRLPAWARVAARGPLFRLSGRFVKTGAIIGGDAPPSTLALLEEAHRAVSPGVMALRAREILAVDVREPLRRCPVPVFYLGAAGDRLVRRRSFEEIRRIRPDVVDRWVPGPHMILQARPKESAEAILHFLEALDTPAGR